MSPHTLCTGSPPLPLCEELALCNRTIDSCDRCSLATLCRSAAPTDRIATVRTVVAPGRALYIEGRPTDAIYALRSGSIKEVVTRPSGTESVLQVALAGEVIGLAGLFGADSKTSAIALTETHLCRLSRTSLERLATEAPRVGMELLRLLAARVNATQEILSALFEQTALARVATFVLDISSRLQRAGLDGSRFRLAVSRRDIASYLGLTIETVSRCMTELGRLGAIDVSAKNLHVLDRTDLRLIADSVTG